MSDLMGAVTSLAKRRGVVFPSKPINHANEDRPRA